MAYEKGTQTKELRAEHAAGGHKEKRNLLCDRCSVDSDPYPEDWHHGVLEAALRDEAILADHREGKHAERPNPSCIDCP